MKARDICGVSTGRFDDQGEIVCPKWLPCPDHPTVNDVDYHPWMCGANCEVCADRGDG